MLLQHLQGEASFILEVFLHTTKVLLLLDAHMDLGMLLSVQLIRSFQDLWRWKDELWCYSYPSKIGLDTALLTLVFCASAQYIWNRSQGFYLGQG